MYLLRLCRDRYSMNAMVLLPYPPFSFAGFRSLYPSTKIQTCLFGHPSFYPHNSKLPFSSMIDLPFGLVFIREYFLHPPLLECPYTHPGRYQFVFRHVEDWCEVVDIHRSFQPFTEFIGKSFVRISAGLSFPGIVLMRSFSVRICWRR